jgi:hypothetical protein
MQHYTPPLQQAFVTSSAFVFSFVDRWSTEKKQAKV